MINIKTYIRNFNVIDNLININENYNKYFVYFDDTCMKYVKKNCYLEGALIIEFFDEIVMGFEYWDLIDCIWIYLINGVNNIIINEDKFIKFDFPDQPIQLIIKEIYSNRLLIEICENKIVLDKSEFVLKTLIEAHRFFKICQKNNLISEGSKYLLLIEELLLKIN